MTEREILEGEIYEIIYQNEDNGYTVCDIEYNKNVITACGYMPFISPGEGVKLTGRWIEHPDYGTQFSVEETEKMLPKKESSILSYLSSGIIPGVRESTAKKIVKAFGENSLEIIAQSPEKLSEVKGISLDKAKKISEAFLIRQEASETVIFLQKFGVAPSLSMKIHKKFGSLAISLIRENPYILCDSIERVGFKTADRIAEAMGIAKDFPKRIQSGIKYALLLISLSGHTCYKKDELILYSSRLLGCEILKIEEGLIDLKNNGEIIIEDDFVFLPMYYNAELISARRLSEMIKTKKISRFLDFDIAEISASLNLELSDMQKEAVKMANECFACVITGGPGTGKTTIMKVILELFKKHNLKVSLCAPTGKAAKRLTESCRCEAKTLHRLLEVDMSGGGEYQTFVKNEHNPIDADVLIVDEMSMVDALLFSSLLKALKRGARIIMAGDSDQLPSVGAGDVLRDILRSGKIPSVRLNEVFRQASESRIVTNAHRINAGLMPLENDSKTDFFFINRDVQGTVNTICELCESRLKKAYGFDLNDIQVLSPSRKGLAGTQNLNRVLQDRLNPPSKDKKEKKFGERIFRVGDKVIQTRNNYDLIYTTPDGKTEGMGIYNGDIGVILDISPKDKIITIRFDENRIVEYDFSYIEDLDISYALTVHKSQGSEWSCVIIPICSFPPMLMTKNLLYTAVTRAKNLVVLVGRSDSLSRMVRCNQSWLLHTSLRRRIDELFS